MMARRSSSTRSSLIAVAIALGSVPGCSSGSAETSASADGSPTGSGDDGDVLGPADARSGDGAQDAGDATVGTNDAGPSADAAADAGMDAAVDGAPDVTAESGNGDAAVDAPADGAADGASDSGDAAVDAPADGAADGAGDSGDAAVDAPADGPADGSGDSGDAVDAPTDGAPDGPLTCSLATGTWLDPRTWDSCDDTFCNCYGYAPDAGSLQAEYGRNEIMNITSLTLPVPMTPGMPYSLSVSVVDNGFYGDVEIWGSTGVCGPGFEKLYTQPVQTKVYCADLVASQPYAYLLYVQRLFVDSGAPASEHADTIVACPTARCAQ